MVKTELSYNPYLRETIVKFNGREPRINSQVEKYQNCKLQEWLDKLPVIFHDEMNGYGFEFLFSGIEADYQRIKNAFKKLNVSEKDVTFFFKNELDSPVKKKTQINELSEWLEMNRNVRFDYDTFKDKYKEILDAPYSFITVHGGSVSSIKLAGEVINIENIENVDEITATDLTNIPVVMYINSSDNIENRKNLQSVICREDINNKQIFFCIKQGLNKPQIQRIISDLGVDSPNIISGLDDKIIEEYFEVYPLTEYIRTVLDIYRDEIGKIQTVLDDENRKNQIKNTEIYSKISRIENDIKLLKEADILFVQRDNFYVPEAFSAAVQTFSQKVSDWRKKKTKTTSVEEAMKMSIEFNAELEKYYSEFVSEVDKAAVEKSEEIDELFGKWFGDTLIEPGYEPVVDFSYEANEYITPKLDERFMKLRTEQYVDSKGSIFDLFKSNTDNVPKEKSLEVTFTYEVWRSTAMEEYLPICQKVIDDWTMTLSKYYVILANVYHKHINELIVQKTEEKNSTANQLSEEEKMLQDDNDWLTVFKDKVHLIERG